MDNLTHFDENGNPRMVDVSDKDITQRIAIARGSIRMQAETLELIKTGNIHKGDVLSVATCAGIMAAKQTGGIIPMCHPLGLDGCEISFTFNETEPAVEVKAMVRVYAKTGVEMEALTAVSVACLTIYDMCKAYDKAMIISDIMLVSKSGGKSGKWYCAGSP
ncbi:cyclic pyranopterin monophosphate synthase MoaC [bacterium]|nr:cyclic pyranopterin monophosphate synthase MoaC [bacterium]MBU1753151.1 cyclic pyranopterin monophosphate synthase MoaC [bacterium]